ncbi:MAG: carboxypeptidase regulatory-like domain-containing protein [Planctomycetes bacterium]|nr:carboxypeptidase regulatory-like domain-containing protein [Planctomycetota bacterium]MBI3844380.1 carboxypeptidase regulatory-like domain-containing protein [Planctomycetota bacterium]
MRRLLLFAVVLLVAIAGIVFWIHHETLVPSPRMAPSETAASPPTEVATVTMGRATEVQQAEPPAIVAEREQTTVAFPSRKAIVDVRVRRSTDDSPVPGVTVKLTIETPNGERTRVAGTTDGEGRSRYEVDVPGVLTSVAAEATTTTGWGLWDEGSVLRSERSTEISLIVSPGRTIRGIVLNELGQPVAGADVVCWLNTTQVSSSRPPDRSATTGPDGSFRLEGVSGVFALQPDDSSLAFRYIVCGKMPTDRDVEGLVLRLARSRNVSGSVVDSGGSPVSGATVRVTTPLSSSGASMWTGKPCDGFMHGNLFATHVTDEQGRFHQKVPANVDVSCRVTHPDYPSASAVARAEQTEVAILLESGLPCEGTVRSANGEPIAGAVVSLEALERRETRTDEHGRFVLKGLSPFPKPGVATAASALLTVRKPGQAIRLIELPVVQAGMPPLQVTLEPSLVLAGRVVDRERAGVPGARIQIEGDRRLTKDPQAQNSQQNRTWEHCLQHDVFLTDADGRFRVDDLYDGVFRVIVMAPNSKEPTAVIACYSGREDLEIVLGEGLTSFVTLRGRVFEASSGAPVTAFEVEVQPSPGEPTHHFTDSLGRFEIEGVAAGDSRIAIRVDDRRLRGYALLERLLPGVIDLEFPLIPPRTLRLQVLDAIGGPCATSWIEVHDAPGRDMGRYDVRGILAQGGVDELGRVAFDNLPAVPVTVAVAIGGGRPRGTGQQFGFDLRLPGNEERVIRLSPAKD